jgi:hypothetical protein
MTSSSQNARVAAFYKLPATLNARQINKLSMGAFANHSFTDARGFHITSISDFGFQLRKGDRIENVNTVTNTDQLEHLFTVEPQSDPTW